MNTSSINLLQTVERILASSVNNRATKRRLYILLREVKRRNLPIDAKQWPNIAGAIVRYYGQR